tara:strand:- start:853 stop:1989 length:1137 start_codon:yes stop_codon:yes gene_type:complete
MSFFYALLGFLSYLRLVRLNKNKKVIFFSESKNYRNYLLNLIKILGKENNLSVIYLTSDLNDLKEIPNKINPIYIGAGFFRILIFTFIECEMLIMTLTDLGNHEIKRSKNCKNYVYLFHSLVSTHKLYTHKAFENYDIILSNGEYQKRELEICEKLFKFKKKKIFNTGYIYLEHLIENKIHNINSSDEKKILVALSWNKSAKNLFDDYAENIIKKLIDEKFHAILRIHPETLKRSNRALKNIKKNLLKFNNFELNTDLTNLKPINDSSLLITDNGGMALEYFIAQKKPVLYINYSEKIHNEFLEKIDLPTVEDRFKEDVGTAMQIDQLNELKLFIKKTKDNFNKNKEKINSLVLDNKIVLKNQSQNSKRIILELLFKN